MNDLRKRLGIDDWLEIVKEDPNCNGAYISFAQYMYLLEQENQKYKEVINKAIELLGNYKHYSTPNEEQNSDNEDLVNKAFDILKEVEHE